jgi:prepilin-type N-terminal cleavage/methylation domain-containing protein
MKLQVRPTRVSRRRSIRTGFTLIELLTVIAIIALLAAILFPVLSIAREKMRQGQCMSNMHSIGQALSMYREDWKAYPDALYGIAYAPEGSSSFGPLQYRLFLPDYVRDEKVFTCPNSPAKAPPPEDRAGVTLVQPINRMTGAPAVDEATIGPYRQVGYAPWSSYDFQWRPNRDISGLAELRYNKWWTWTPDPFTRLAGLTEDRRQLRFRNPPESTVITWCLYHTNMNSSGDPSRGSHALVLYKSGRVQTIDAQKLAVWPAECTGAVAGGTNPQYCPWQVSPRP